MKVGICTFHGVDNYGAVLQCLGSVQVLRQLGHEPVVVDYFPDQFSVSHGSPLAKIGIYNGTAKQKLRELASWEGLRNIEKLRAPMPPSDEHPQYEAFRHRHLPLSPPLTETTIWPYLEGLDALYVGSDQIWRKFSPRQNFFLLDHCRRPRKISYAASFGVLPKESFVPELLKQALGDFSAVSVRDRFSQEYLQKCGINSTLVADPTILADFEPFSQKPKSFPTEIEGKPFLLVYALDRWQGGLCNQVCRLLRRKLQIPIVSIRRGNWYGGDADYPLADVGPGEWLWLFQHAAFVCTDSFHGSIFSLKNHKNFITYFAEDYYRAARLSDMRKELGLNCFINQAQLPASVPDYEAAQKILNDWKLISLEFLKNALA